MMLLIVKLKEPSDSDIEYGYLVVDPGYHTADYFMGELKKAIDEVRSAEPDEYNHDDLETALLKMGYNLHDYEFREINF